MKIRIIIFIIALNMYSLSAFAQQLQLEKASPFTAVKWINEQPIVQFNNQWYHFIKLAHFNKKELLDYCKQQFGRKWKKRFSEDLLEVLQGFNYIPNKEVKLILSKNNQPKTYTGIFSFENRQSCLRYNQQLTTNKKTPNKISKLQAIEDLKQFQIILETKSSYLQLSTFDYKTAIEQLISSVSKEKEEIIVDELTNKMSKIMSEIGDRHSSIKNESFDQNKYPTYGLKLPFGLAVLDDKIIAVQQNSDATNYKYVYTSYPYVTSINGIAIDQLLNENYKDKKAPKEAKLSRAASAFEKFGALLFKNNQQCPTQVEVGFSDGKNTIKEIVELTENKQGYVSSLMIANHNDIKNIKTTEQLDNLSSLLNHNIGYIKIPMMFGYKEVNGVEAFLKNTVKNFSTTKALIIDIRNNPGGSREILQTFANYIVQPEQSPWVANIAYLRTDQTIITDEQSMSSRYLHTYNSDNFSNKDKKAIEVFSETFKTEKEVDTSKFSRPFYMVLHAGKNPYTKPVYILVNEKSFSAASVFTSAFKGLPNVKIVGVTTDGSSGNSKIMYLQHSNIRVKVSTMLSFQRNGKTLDGNGTKPDMYIPIDSEHIFTGNDTQLKKLVALINQ